MLFGDSIFRGLLQSITNYYHTISPNILTIAKLKCNATLRSARQLIKKASPAVYKKNYNTNHGYQLAKKGSFAFEQLRIKFD
jgi:hypothetical protein